MKESKQISTGLERMSAMLVGKTKPDWAPCYTVSS
jgi:hypothetical protein